MSKMIKHIPKLRFPEFQNAPEWEEKTLMQVSEIIMGQSPDSNAYNTLKNGKPLIQGNTDIINRRTSPRIWTTESTKECHKGDIIFTVRAPVGAVAKSLHDACIGRGVCAIQPNENSEFLYQFLLIQEEKWDKLSQGSTFTAINSNDIKNFKVNIPKLSEQKKIAECLSSLDALILAQSSKVEALKAHKKALMQQLFPAEGETTPCLRFPEFQNAPKWEEKPLGVICDYWNGDSHESGVSDDGEYFLISLNSLDIEGNLKANMKKVNYLDGSLEKDDLVMVLSDVAHGNFLGLTAIIPNSNYVLNQRMAGLRKKANEEIVIEFLRLYINYKQKYFKQHGQGSSQLNLSKSSVTDFPVLLPASANEQQKIAECLSSLDELISAQSSKVEALKQHKKALMQQLFPKSEDK